MSLVSRGLVIIFLHGSRYAASNAGRGLMYTLKYLIPPLVLAVIVGVLIRFIALFALINDKHRESDSWVVAVFTTAILSIIVGCVAHTLAEQEMKRHA